MWGRNTILWHLILIVGLTAGAAAQDGKDWTAISAELCQLMRADKADTFAATIAGHGLQFPADYIRIQCPDGEGSLLRLVIQYNALSCGKHLIGLLAQGPEGARGMQTAFSVIDPDGKTLLDFLKTSMETWLGDLESADGDAEVLAALKPVFNEQTAYLFDFRKNGAAFACELRQEPGCAAEITTFFQRVSKVIDTYRAQEKR